MSTDNTHSESHLPFHVLIAAAGKGRRLGADTPKQYRFLAGRPVLRHSVELFLKHPLCQSVRVIIDSQDVELYHDAVAGLSLLPPLFGGTERKDSITNALKNISDVKDEEIILVHDAARPCLSLRDLNSLLAALHNARAASLAVPVSSTLRYGAADGTALDPVERKGLWALQTPQGFRFGDLKRAHDKAPEDMAYTDDSTLLSACGIPVTLVEGSAHNIKITYAENFIMAEQFLGLQRVTVTGQGFDVHRFDLEKSGPVRLCGVDVPHPHALKGHSDADVGLHALTDAILGAIGAGDIGRHFPPSDPQFKNMDSVVFLEHALHLMEGKGAKLVHLDVTLICEAPKISPYAEAMQSRLAQICTLPLARVNIKATTTEGLGFTGRKEGIAAQALATLTLLDETHNEP